HDRVPDVRRPRGRAAGRPEHPELLHDRDRRPAPHGPPKPTLSPGAELIPTFGVTGGRNRAPPREPARDSHGSSDIPPAIFPITDIFVQYGKKQLVQLTNYRRVDTWAGFLTRDRKRAVFLASADPVRMNPDGNCQLFSVDVHGGVPRQITHLDPGRPVIHPGCALPYGIG